MKRMVKNGDLLDVSEDGSGVSFGGNLKVGGTIIANGEIRGGNVSASKFYLGTEEMPLVKANPAGEAAGTLEKIKIGNVAYKVGGGSGDREITLIMPYPSSDSTSDKKLYIDQDIWDKIKNCYYEAIKISYNDGNPLGVFHPLNVEDSYNNIKSRRYACISDYGGTYNTSAWYGFNSTRYWFAVIRFYSDSNGKYIIISGTQPQIIPDLSKEAFDNLYKLADKPTQDGTYILKATVSGGAVTYTWEPQA